ncbi:MAG: extracellular solute-binding protein [bacterium]|nr:extracellular solute-binding protein [bacterium]
MKRTFATVSLAMLTAFGLAACGGGNGGGGTTTPAGGGETTAGAGGETTGGEGGEGGLAEAELTMLAASYSDNTTTLWQEVIDAFEADNPGVTIELEIQSWENINDVIRTKVQSNQAPDILSIDAFSGYVEDELLYSADEILSEETIADFQDGFIQNATMDGKQYGFPLIASARALFVNDAILEEAGASVPTTWDELHEAAQLIVDNTDAYGYGMPLGNEEAQAELGIWIFSGGGGYGSDSEITVDSAENLAAVEFMKKMIDDGLTQPNAGATQRTPMQDAFIQGEYGMVVGLPPMMGWIEERNPDLEYSIVDIPTVDGSQATLGVADHLMAFKNDGDKGAQIGAFLDFFYQADNYVKFVDTEGFLPVTKSGAEGTTLDQFAPFTELLPFAQFYPSTNPAWSATQAEIQSQIGTISTGANPADVLAGIQSVADNS